MLKQVSESYTAVVASTAISNHCHPWRSIGVQRKPGTRCTVEPCAAHVWIPRLAQSSSGSPGMFLRGISLTHPWLPGHPNLAGPCPCNHRRWCCDCSALGCPSLGHPRGPGTFWGTPLPRLRIGRTDVSSPRLLAKPDLASFWRDRHFWVPCRGCLLHMRSPSQSREEAWTRFPFFLPYLLAGAGRAGLGGIGCWEPEAASDGAAFGGGGGGFNAVEVRPSSCSGFLAVSSRVLPSGSAFPKLSINSHMSLQEIVASLLLRHHFPSASFLAASARFSVSCCPHLRLQPVSLFFSIATALKALSEQFGTDHPAKKLHFWRLPCFGLGPCPQINILKTRGMKWFVVSLQLKEPSVIDQDTATASEVVSASATATEHRSVSIITRARGKTTRTGGFAKMTINLRGKICRQDVVSIQVAKDVFLVFEFIPERVAGRDPLLQCPQSVKPSYRWRRQIFTNFVAFWLPASAPSLQQGQFMARVFAHGAVEELPPVHAADQLARSEFFLAVFQDPFFGFLKIPLHLLHQLLRQWKGSKTNTNIV